MESVTDSIKKLRDLMAKEGIDYYVIPTADFHQSEYVGEHFKARKFITGFTGSAGTAVISQKEAGLWTDGRYFIQAANQIKGTPVTLFKMGEPEVPTIPAFLRENLKAGETIGFDGRVVAMSDGLEYESIAREKDGKIVSDKDLINEVWTDRPPLSEEKAFALEEKYTGESVASKLQRIRQVMTEKGADVHVLNTLDDICWTLNIRGNDIDFFPLVLTYAIITRETMDLYINEEKLSEAMKADLLKDGVHTHPYDSFYDDLGKISAQSKVMIDPVKVNYRTYNCIPPKATKIKTSNPEIIFKAMKNETEIKNIREAQIKDSICHVKFMKWIKENYDKTTITELSASAKLDELREAMDNYIRPSFAPICAYGPHSASPHYESSPETDVPLEEGNFFLTDTGAGFMEGSTDITRTYAIGEVSDDKKEHFTLVAISNLQLASGKFLYGSTGMVLDILSRKPFWDRDLNFNHGTGHGVGYLLNIHEGPAGFRWTFRDHESHQIEEGMILTDEPGLYFEGSHGVRLENELLARKGTKNEYGQFMYFEPITYVPMDLDAIKPEIMSAEDKKLLNDYHATVFEKIAPYLNEEEVEWLKKYTREIN
ncbi:MAG TPA: aminopeptidase P family N-terminal domain-containing protein [Candidatus Dorea intestinavium]|nr:aminopeptidase P family N-terminal domain-containing protein [Candidatus Dorea intestinavium]